MAPSLGVIPGQAGQAVTVTALAGLLFAPTVGLLLPRLDRRSLLMWAAVAATVSSLVVALVPSLVAILVARFLLGAAIRAFWAISITVAAAGEPDRIGRALMFGSAGVSLATAGAYLVRQALVVASMGSSARGACKRRLRHSRPGVIGLKSSSDRDV